VDAGDFTGRLLNGERVLWLGRPSQGLLFTSRDWLMIPFSLLWGGFAIFWEATVLQTRSSAPLLFKLWGVPFILIGLYLIAGRFVFDAWIRRKTRYALTNQRILIARSGGFGTFTAVGLDGVPDVQLKAQANGRGTMHFGRPAPNWGRAAVWTPALDPTPQFMAIDNAQAVFDQIQRAIRAA
jgi:hypothetical protein